jgi:formylglycine-generating enzyme required for sulfatase activity
MRGDVRALGLEELTAATPEEVVVLSAFHLDRDEFSVGQYRELRREHPSLPEPVVSGSGADLEPGLSPFIPGTNDPAGYCTYLGANDSTNDALPLNCVSRSLAEVLCQAREMRLPTEAEWEFAAGNRALETRYPWGNDTTDPCAHAVFGLSYEALGVGSSRCRTQRPEGDRDPWVRAGGADRDVTELGIKNLSGNLSEWISDTLVPYSDACWSRSPWLVDPHCDAAGESVVRGGNWRDGSFMLESTSRNSAPGSESIAVGFRCARDAGSK